MERRNWEIRPLSPRSSRSSSTTARYSRSRLRVRPSTGTSSGRSSTSTRSSPRRPVWAAPAMPRWRPESSTARPPPGSRTWSTTSATVPTFANSSSCRGTSSTRSSSPTSTVSVTLMLGKTTMSSRGTSSKLLIKFTFCAYLRSVSKCSGCTGHWSRPVGTRSPQTGRNVEKRTAAAAGRVILMAQVTANGIDELKELIGQEVGPSGWREVTQELIDTFAEVSGDDQWIHVDVERAKTESPFGTTVAHGNLTLSVIDGLRKDLIQSQGFALGVNYGWNKVRFPAPVPSGSRVRAKAGVVSVDEVGGGWYQVVTRFTVEVEGNEKPACVAESVGRALPA